jgi:hypothetical protein
MGRSMPQWISSQLQILDIGYVAPDRTSVRDPLALLGILHRPDMRCVAEWLNRYHRSGTTVWHRQSWTRTERYLTQHNLPDQTLRDVDMDVLLHLVAPHVPIRVWTGGQIHSQALWLRTTVITPHIWQRLTYRDWVLEEYDIRASSPPQRRYPSYLNP